jgi:uncharacterized protein YndB with AHSA1/START domain
MVNKTKMIAEPGKQEIFIAFTDPKLYSQWLGPRRLTTIFEKLESKNGGGYRFINEDEKGNKFAFHGIYHEVLAPERIIGTFEYEGLPEKGHVSLEITKFEELPEGRTKLTYSRRFHVSRRPRWNDPKRHGRRSQRLNMNA